MDTARASTPTIRLEFSDQELDLTSALHVYVTLKQGSKIMTKKDTDLAIEPKIVEFELTQKETLEFAEGEVKVQANATYAGGKRVPSKVRIFNLSEQLLEEEIE